MATASRGGAAMHWLTESVSGTDGFDWYVDGAAVRRWWMVEGEVISNVGEAVAGEPEGGIDSLESYDIDEWVIATVVEAMVAPWDTLLGGEYYLVLAV